MDAARKNRDLSLMGRVALCAQMVADQLQETPGGDAYEFVGSMNDVDELREALEAWCWRDETTAQS